ncbi:MAG: hypothetical protein J5711_00405 [Bacteroidales bacterium]|nr:hypothetical protein [Bacteroidales bacterium]
MKTNNIISKTIVASMVILLFATGCVKDNRYYDPSDPKNHDEAVLMMYGCDDYLSGLWMVGGDISTKDYNSPKDLRGYYLHNRDSVSLHKFDGESVKVWGYRFVGKYSDKPYYDSETGDSVLLIALAPRPLRYARYCAESDPNSRFYYVHPDSTVVYSGDQIVDDNIRPLTDTIHAFLRGEDIKTALENPEKKLLMEGTIDVKQTNCVWWFHCFGMPDCSVGLNVTNLTLSER